MPPADDAPARRTAGRRWGANFLLLLFSLFILIIIEGGLRVAGFGDDLSLMAPSKVNPNYLRVNLGLGKRYFMRRSYGSLGAQDYILKNKTPRILRVVALGGSTTAGYPYHPGGTFPAILKIFLAQAYPDHRIEMVNLGITAVSSFTVLDLANDVLEHAPDLIVVYTGHNELYGALGAASTQKIGGSRNMTLLYMKLRRFRLFQLTRQMVVLTRDALAAKNTTDQTLMFRMAGNRAIGYADAQHQEALDNFEANLTSLVRIASDHRIPLVLGTLVSNLRDQPPFVSMPSDSAALPVITQLLAKAITAIESGDWAGGLDLALAAIVADSVYAQSWYLAGRGYLRLDRTAEARLAFVRAKDLDGLRFRASEALNDIIRQSVQSDGIYLADVAHAFDEASPDGIVGANLMVDHLHPNLEGYFLMAKSFSGVITSRRLLAAGVTPASPKIDRWYKEAIAVSALDKQLAEYRVGMLTSGWPFQASVQRQTLEEVRPTNVIEEFALKHLRGELSYEMSHVMLGRYYEQSGETDKALTEYGVLTQVFPANPSSFIQVGRMHMEAGRLSAALPYLKEAANLSPDPYSWKWTGIILQDEGRLDAAVNFMAGALQLNPGDGELMFRLATAYAASGSKWKARDQIVQLIKLYPDYPGAAQLHRELLQTP